MTFILPPGLALQKADERIMTLNVGPQHPGSGHMRIIVQIDGDYIDIFDNIEISSSEICVNLLTN